MMWERVKQAFQQRFKKEPAVSVRAPGRVNLLGAHVDYNEGWVLPAAIDRSIWLAAAPRNDRMVHLGALDLDRAGQFNLESLLAGPSSGAGLAGWLRYPAGVAWALQDAGYELTGLDAVFAGDVPVGSGVSSSAAVEMAFVLAWETLSDLSLTGLERARVGQRAENHFLGVSSGIMDQFASLHGAAGHVIYLDCRTLEYKLIPLPAGTAALVADTGVRRELAFSEYNQRRQECQEALEILRQEVPGLRALRDVGPDLFAEVKPRLPQPLRRRAQHVVEECARVQEGVRALQAGNLQTFGEVVRRSHLSSRDLYQVSIAELDVLAEAAWGVEGCFGARLTGAGFGGCVVALVSEDAAAEVRGRMKTAFAAAFNRKPVIMACRIADGAQRSVING